MNIDIFNDLSKFVDGKTNVFVIVDDMDIIEKIRNVPAIHIKKY